MISEEEMKLNSALYGGCCYSMATPVSPRKTPDGSFAGLLMFGKIRFYSLVAT